MARTKKATTKLEPNEPMTVVAEGTRVPVQPIDKESDGQHSSNGAVQGKNGRAKQGKKPIGTVTVSGVWVGGETNPSTEPNMDLTPTTPTPAVPTTVPEISTVLQAYQRQRAVLIKSRIMQSNRILHVVAGTMGYSSGLKEKERMKLFGEARVLIKKVLDGKAEHAMSGVINTTYIGIDAFEEMQRTVEKQMVKLAKTLPVAPWVIDVKRRGFGLLGLAIVVGECGDLSNYENPGKLWRRMGCAPWTFEGKTLMGATWKSGREGRLNAEQWTEFGYSPRRRSIAYLFGEAIVKQNGGHKPKGKKEVEEGNGAGPHEHDEDVASEHSTEAESPSAVCGPYRARYDFVKVDAAKKHPEWTPLRVHRHAMLLATKMLLRDLWVEWRKADGTWTPNYWHQEMEKVAARHSE